MTIVLIVAALCVVARIALAVAQINAPARHARWKMRAKLADLVYRDKLTPVLKVKNGKILR